MHSPRTVFALAASLFIPLASVTAIASAPSSAPTSYCGTYHRLPSCGAQSVMIDLLDVNGVGRLWLQAGCDADTRILCDLRSSINDLLVDGQRYCIEAEAPPKPAPAYGASATSCRDADVTLTRIWKDEPVAPTPSPNPAPRT